MAKSNLVIVESPAKAKTIGKYLGPGYEVKASMGHVRDLPKSKLGVDVEHGFELNYQPIKGKEEVIDELKKSAKKSEKVFLATDPDREGEAISWHLKEMLGIPDDKTYRVTFNEITKKVVNDSIAHPRAIDMDLVNAQQARRVLDRIVGYQISPLLWKKIRRGLSAGRVQSVATRMVDDRDREIEEFKPEEYWTLDANLFGDDAKKLPFAARYHGKVGKKAELKSAEDVDAVVHETEHAPFTVKTVKRTDKQRSPSPPFTTSTMQQEASRRLGVPFGIVDLSLAPTPAIGDSVARILEEMGLETCGTHGTTAALALLNDAVKKGGVMASSHVGGLSGAFIPVSEDEGMIAAARSGALHLDKLEAMTCVCSVGLDMIAVPGDTTAATLSAIIADEAAIGMVNSKTTAVRVIPAIGKKAGEELSFGGLLGEGPVMEVNPCSPAKFIHRGGRIPAPLQSLKN